MKYGVPKTSVDTRRLEKLFQYNRIQDMVAGKEDISWKRSGEELAEIIRAIVTGGSAKTVVNIPNQGQIDNLPEGSLVETLGVVGKDGISPIGIGALPKVIESWCRTHIDVQELTLEAALHGDRQKLMDAFCLDPITGQADFCEIRDMCEELLSANRMWLPRFFS